MLLGDGSGRRLRRERRHRQVLAEENAATFFAQMAETGLKQNVMTVRWRPSDPTAIPDEAALERAVPAALAAGIAPVFAVYPYPASELEGGGVSPADVRDLARRARAPLPGREDVHRRQRAQPEHLLAARRATAPGRSSPARRSAPSWPPGYDALKSVSPEIRVLGVGSSPRGEERRVRQASHSPVHFLASLGAWYRGSGRPTRLMDGYSFHPYPNPSDFRVPFSFTYGWPNAGVLELGRDQAGALGRLQRHAAADDAQRPEALPRRGGLAGRHARATPPTRLTRTCA